MTRQSGSLLSASLCSGKSFRKNLEAIRSTAATVAAGPYRTLTVTSNAAARLPKADIGEAAPHFSRFKVGSPLTVVMQLPINVPKLTLTRIGQDTLEA